MYERQRYYQHFNLLQSMIFEAIRAVKAHIEAYSIQGFS